MNIACLLCPLHESSILKLDLLMNFRGLSVAATKAAALLSEEDDGDQDEEDYQEEVAAPPSSEKKGLKAWLSWFVMTNDDLYGSYGSGLVKSMPEQSNSIRKSKTKAGKDVWVVETSKIGPQHRDSPTAAAGKIHRRPQRTTTKQELQSIMAMEMSAEFRSTIKEVKWPGTGQICLSLYRAWLLSISTMCLNYFPISFCI